jgi:F0F1-type ATP synthase assembly protein I
MKTLSAGLFLAIVVALMTLAGWLNDYLATVPGMSVVLYIVFAIGFLAIIRKALEGRK